MKYLVQNYKIENDFVQHLKLIILATNTVVNPTTELIDIKIKPETRQLRLLQKRKNHSPYFALLPVGIQRSFPSSLTLGACSDVIKARSTSESS